MSMFGDRARSTQEDMLEGLGVELIDVRVWTPKGWADERHVDDMSTLQATIGMTMGRLGGHCAVFPWHLGGWALYDRVADEVKVYPTQEAAEMVAIHRGH